MRKITTKAKNLHLTHDGHGVVGSAPDKRHFGSRQGVPLFLKSQSGTPSGELQRQEEEEPEEEAVQAKADGYAVQAQSADEEDEEIQAKREVFSIQAKLSVSQPDDPYEKEADHVANRVMSVPEIGVQRSCCDDEQRIGAKSVSPAITPIQRNALQRQGEEEAEALQTKPETNHGSLTAPERVKQHVRSLEGGGEPLPGPVRGFFGAARMSSA